jgi:hypothetical protein
MSNKQTANILEYIEYNNYDKQMISTEYAVDIANIYGAQLISSSKVNPIMSILETYNTCSGI